MTEQSVRERYFTALQQYIASQDEAQLMAAADLGRALVQDHVPPEEIAEIHEGALQRLAEEKPGFTLLEAARLVSAPLMELLMAYGLAFREQIAVSNLQATTLEASANAIIITDYKGNILWANPAYSDLTGYPLREITGQNPRFMQSGKQDQAFYENLWNTILAGDVWRGMLVNRRKGGELYNEEMTITPVKDRYGEISYFIAVKQDVTERKSLEQQSQRLLKQQVAANQLALSLGESLELTDIYQIFYTHVLELMDVDTFIISSYDQAAQLIHASYAIMEGAVLDIRTLPPIPLEEDGHGTQSQVVRSGKPIYLPDFRAAMEHTKTELSVTEDGEVIEGLPLDDERDVLTNSAILVPMKVKGETVGVMQVQSHSLDAYSQQDVDLLSALANVASISIQNARLFAEAHQRMERLKSLRSIDQAISGTVSLSIALEVVLEQVINQLEVDAAAVLLYQKELHTLEFSVGRGFRTAALQHTNLRLGQGLSGIAALERRTTHIPDLRNQETEFHNSPRFKDEGFVSYYGVPLLAKGQLAGVLEIFHREPLSFSAEWEEFMETLASQAAIAIDNVTMFKDLRTSNMELILAYDATIEGWARALELRDMETEGHSRRVVDLTIKIAREMGVFDQELVHVRRGALLHDIGKMGIPDNILQKKGPLSAGEWAIMRQHPVHAFEMLSPIAYLRPALDIPCCHHEKWDGSGYPRGLKGDQIPLPARIFAVVDVWDALLSDRPYRKAWPEAKVIGYLREQSGQHFDPRVVGIFLILLEDTISVSSQ